MVGAGVGPIGSWVGITAAAIVFTYLDIRRARGPLEKRLIVKSAPWLCGYVVVVGIILRPHLPWFLHMLIYGVGLFLAVLWLHRKQASVRREEESQR